MKPYLLLIPLLLCVSAFPASAAPDGGAPVAASVASTPAAPATSPAVVTSPSPAAPAAVATREGAAESQSWWKALLVDAIRKALEVFALVLSALLFLLLRKLGVKVELETLDALAGKAALYAEKKAATALGEGKPKSSGAEKEAWAWELVNSVDAKLGGSAKAREKLRGLILAKIPEAESAVSLAKNSSAVVS